MKDYLIDTHCHIDIINNEGISLDDIFAGMRVNSVKKVIIPAVEISTQNSVVELANKYDNLYGMVGIFPTEAKTYTDEYEKKMEQFAKNSKKIVAVGEIGLDYYWDKTSVDLQKDIFKRQIKLANRLHLPIVVHDREAHKDCFDIIKEEKPQNGALFHCFSGSSEFMKECVKEGWYIAIGGVVTFKNALKIKDVARDVPLDKLVLETDAPYLTSVPFRGKTNKPEYVKFVAEEIAKIRQISVEELTKITTENAERFFKI